MYYKLDKRLQTGTNIITKYVSYFKLGRILLLSVPGTSNSEGYYYNGVQVFQTGTNIVTEWVRYFKLG